MSKQKILGENIQRLRKRSGIKQADFAAAIGVAGPTLSIYEQGKTSPKPATLEKIAGLLNVGISELYRDPQEKQVPETDNNKTSPSEISKVSVDELMKYGRVFEAAKSVFPTTNEEYKPLKEVFDTGEAMIRKLETQAQLVRDLQVQLDFATKLLESKGNS